MNSKFCIFPYKLLWRESAFSHLLLKLKPRHFGFFSDSPNMKLFLLSAMGIQHYSWRQLFKFSCFQKCFLIVEVLLLTHVPLHPRIAFSVEQFIFGGVFISEPLHNGALRELTRPLTRRVNATLSALCRVPTFGCKVQAWCLQSLTFNCQNSFRTALQT